MTWKNLRDDDSDWRKDIVEGTEGTIEGFADEAKRQALLKILLDVGKGKKKEICQPCNPKNLSTTSEVKAKKAGEAAGAPPSKKSKKAEKDKEDTPAGPPSWCKCGSKDDEYKVESGFKDLLVDSDAATRIHFLKALIK